MRESYETVAGGNNLRRDLGRGVRVELLYIVPDRLKVCQRRRSPYDGDQMRYGVGRGNSSGVPHDFSHSTTFS